MAKNITVFISQLVNNNIKYIGSYDVKADSIQPVRIKAVNNATYQIANADSGFSVERAAFKQVNNDLYISVNDSTSTDIIIEDYYSNQGEIAGFPQSSISNPADITVATTHQPVVAEQVAATEFSNDISDSAMLKILGGVLGVGAIAAFALGGGGNGGSSGSSAGNTGSAGRNQSGGNGDNQGSFSNNWNNHHEASSSGGNPSPNGEAVKTTVTVHYPNGEVITYETTTNDPFSYKNIQYVVDSPDFVSMEQINSYFSQHPLTLDDIKRAYKTDTDNDGVIDIHDKNPTVWDVSNRDLRMFSTLAYSDEAELKAIFEQHSPSAIDNINRKNDAFNNVTDVQEVSKHWKLLRADSPGEGLQYAIFGNGEKPEGGYENVVVAFRGTNFTSLSDIINDLQIYKGKLPLQASYLNKVAEYINSYNPSHIYSTGHSLGGYLAQLFASHTVKNQSGWFDKFERSALFNPVPINIKADSNQTLINARKLSDEMTNIAKFDDSDISNTAINNHKTDSYVITGEFVSHGSWLAGLGTFLGGGGLSGLDGLGTYKNTQFFDFKKDITWGKHSLSSFYEQDNKLKTTFSKGYRMNAHYSKLDTDNDGITDVAEKHIGTNLNMWDSDGDGFSDALEVKIGSDPLNAKFTPYTVNNAIKVTVKTEFGNGKVDEREVTLQAHQENNQLVYRIADESALNLNATLPKFAKNNIGTPFISGSPYDDILFTGEGKARLVGGEGKDKFVFNTVVNGSVDELLDFNPKEDKIVLAKAVFNALKEDLSNYQEHLFYDKASGQLSYNNTNSGAGSATVFASLGSGLDLNKSNFEIV